jgi:putative oxidoreductase
MKKRNLINLLLIETNPQLLSTCILLLRITIGIILFIIGAGKVLGWFGGSGMEITIQSFVSRLGISPLLAYLSSYTEFIGGLLLIVGLLTRLAAFAVMINMVVATIVLLPKGFIAGGAAFPFTLMISAVIILLAGPMLFSLDSLLFRRSE